MVSIGSKRQPLSNEMVGCPHCLTGYEVAPTYANLERCVPNEP
uniref:Uncharacterized protein n=1 Tax=Picea glauca TaxID=3330 RepID=A0A101LTV3_PICGL|nr:hypothetical protein ABT39_MTgene3557 [Picea glauca]